MCTYTHTQETHPWERPPNMPPFTDTVNSLTTCGDNIFQTFKNTELLKSEWGHFIRWKTWVWFNKQNRTVQVGTESSYEFSLPRSMGVVTSRQRWVPTIPPSLEAQTPQRDGKPLRSLDSALVLWPALLNRMQHKWHSRTFKEAHLKRPGSSNFLSRKLTTMWKVWLPQWKRGLKPPWSVKPSWAPSWMQPCAWAQAKDSRGTQPPHRIRRNDNQCCSVWGPWLHGKRWPQTMGDKRYQMAESEPDPPFICDHLWFYRDFADVCLSTNSTGDADTTFSWRVQTLALSHLEDTGPDVHNGIWRFYSRNSMRLDNLSPWTDVKLSASP